MILRFCTLQVTCFCRLNKSTNLSLILCAGEISRMLSSSLSYPHFWNGLLQGKLYRRTWILPANIQIYYRLSFHHPILGFFCTMFWPVPWFPWSSSPRVAPEATWPKRREPSWGSQSETWGNGFVATRWPQDGVDMGRYGMSHRDVIIGYGYWSRGPFSRSSEWVLIATVSILATVFLQVREHMV
jgi:hypothetical protein